MKRGSIVFSLSLIALACTLPVFAATVPTSFYDADGNLLTGVDVKVVTDNGGQKFGPNASGVYDVDVAAGQKVQFYVTDKVNAYQAAEVTIPEALEGTLQVVVADAGVNETCDTASPIGIGDTVAGNNSGNTQSNFPGGDFCGTSITSPGIGDWYEFTVPEGGGDRTMTASTCNQASYDTKLSVFCRTCDDQICVGGNDDGVGCAAFSSSFTWCAEEGATYQIFVHGFLGATGAYNLTLSDGGACTATTECIPPPPPTPTGACCSDNCDIVGGAPDPLFSECLDVNCSIQTEADCLNGGGAYAGDATECVTPGAEVFEYSTMPGAPIPDNNSAGVRTELVVPDSFVISDLDVDLNISHTWIGDLQVILTHKDTGTAVTLWRRNCGSSSGLLITSDDEGTQSYCGPSGGPTTGSIPPALTNGFTSFMSDFDGEDIGGTWSLVVDDNFSADTGTVNSWALVATPGTPTCVAGCSPGTGFPGGGDDDDDSSEKSDGLDVDALTSMSQSQETFDGLLELNFGTSAPEQPNSTQAVRDGRLGKQTSR